MVEVRESPISLERKFCEFVRAVFGRRLRKNGVEGVILCFDRRSFVGVRTALAVRSPTKGRAVFPSHEWPDLDIAVRDRLCFEKTLRLASHYQSVTGKRAVVIKEF
jgi:hypothetical protein